MHFEQITVLHWQPLIELSVQLDESRAIQLTSRAIMLVHLIAKMTVQPAIGINIIVHATVFDFSLKWYQTFFIPASEHVKILVQII